jgi:exonuclease III
LSGPATSKEARHGARRLPLSPPLAARLESCGIDRDFRKGQKHSDHALLLAELRD